jgi:ubiquinone/menaquinone biosynthesis C-methylase UbiE
MGEGSHVDAARKVFDASASDYVEFVGTEHSEATEDAVDRSMLAAFAEIVASRGGGLVADVGCGPGRAAAFLARERLDVVGVDVSSELLALARLAHPHVRFMEGRLDDLPFAADELAGAVSWYSIIYTPPELLGDVLAEFARVLAPRGLVLLAFQAGTGDPVVKADAYGSGLAITSYRHHVDDVAQRLQLAGFDVHASTLRAGTLSHETSPQAFIVACRR